MSFFNFLQVENLNINYFIILEKNLNLLGLYEVNFKKKVIWFFDFYDSLGYIKRFLRFYSINFYIRRLKLWKIMVFAE